MKQLKWIFVLLMACLLLAGCNEIGIGQPNSTETGTGTSTEQSSSESTPSFSECKKNGHTYGENQVCTVCGTHRPSEGLKFQRQGNSYCVKDIGTCTASEIFIPDEYEGLPVTSIGEKAFDRCSSLTSVTIPDSVTDIGDSAFYDCSGLTSLTIPDSVTSIGFDALFGCSNLSYHTYDNANYLGNEENPYVVLVRVTSSITSCEIHPQTKLIAYGAFSRCSGLTSIVIPHGMTSIGAGAFSDCSDLTSITLPDGVTSIGNGAFFRCSGLTSIVIPDSVTSIGECAFQYCTGLTSITIPDSVTSIGDCAFTHCDNLTSVTIGNGVMSIGDSAFQYCTGLTDITFVGTQEQWNAVEKGNHWKSNCPAKKVFLLAECEKKGHVEVIDKAKPATCTETGLTKGTHCSVCNRILVAQTETPMLPHTEVIDKARKATCSAFGLTEGKHCSVCNEVIVAQTQIPKLPHTEVVTPEKPSTCSVNGLTEGKYCSVCNLILVSRLPIPKLPHTEVIDQAKPATCTETGLTEGKHCSVCNSVLVPQSVIPKHQYQNGICSACKEPQTKGLKYQLIENSYYEVRGIGTCTDTQIYIPAEYEGLPVKSIGWCAFADCRRLTSIVIPSSVTSIDYQVFFRCQKLQTVTFTGTQEQWDAIEKDATWNHNCAYFEVVCTG